jgi:single-strand DNA-binding protein
MNSITITGNLGKDCESRSLQDGTSIASFSVADSQGKDKPTIWWNCSLFGKRAESLTQYLTKGQQVTVIGTVSEREYTDRDGQSRKSMDIRVSDIALQCGRREEAQAPRQQAAAPRPQPAPQRPAAPRPAPANDFVDMQDDVPW